jgi:trans-aconitate methyltransferase
VRDVVPERIRWAVETLAIEGTERVFEIGGGPGVAASLICDRLTTGSMLLIDRSATAVERTRRRNAKHVVSGRLKLETVELRDFEARGRRFDKVFAVNVNIFWTTPVTEELARLHEALVPGGTLLLFYGTPGANRAHEVAMRVADALRANGFSEPEIVTSAANLICCAAHPS